MTGDHILDTSPSIYYWSTLPEPRYSLTIASTQPCMRWTLEGPDETPLAAKRRRYMEYVQALRGREPVFPVRGVRKHGKRAVGRCGARPREQKDKRQS